MMLLFLPIAIPLFLATLLAFAGQFIPRRLTDLIAIGGALAVGVVCLRLIDLSRAHSLVGWAGGWKPHNGIALGISLYVDPFGAGLATFACLLMAFALLFSWKYFEDVRELYQPLMLVFLAAMCGLCLTGDLFNLFVWFELMTATGVALCGYKCKEVEPLQGALCFAITNTVGAFLTLTGIALLYGKTGALNFAQIAQGLRSADTLVVVAFLFFAGGFLVKAAIVPFHFWLADAHAVAPTPVCVLFSGVMVELGLYAVARVYWSVFSVVLSPHLEVVRDLFLFIGAATVVVGSLYCLLQRHLKRLLAFSTIAHLGVLMLGFALFGPKALVGAAVYVIAHGLVKAALFLCSGMLLHHYRSVDELDLYGKARGQWGLATIYFLAAMGVAGCAPFMSSIGESGIRGAAESVGASWVGWIILFGSAMTGAAVLRAGIRIFFGFGTRSGIFTAKTSEAHEQSMTRGNPVIHWSMLFPAIVLVALALLGHTIPQLQAMLVPYAQRFQDASAYREAMLGAGSVSNPRSVALQAQSEPILHSLVLVGAILFVLMSNFARKSWLRAKLGRKKSPFTSIARGLHGLQSGQVGDYLTWWLVGIAFYGGLLGLAIRG